jgi:hypothetical protein
MARQSALSSSFPSPATCCWRTWPCCPPPPGARLLALAEEYARSLGLPEVRLYTNQAMIENLVYYSRHGYIETHRAQQDGFRRVFFRKRLDT